MFSLPSLFLSLSLHLNSLNSLKMASPFPVQPAESSERNIRPGVELRDFRKDRSDGKM